MADETSQPVRTPASPEDEPAGYPIIHPAGDRYEVSLSVRLAPGVRVQITIESDGRQDEPSVTTVTGGVPAGAPGCDVPPERPARRVRRRWPGRPPKWLASLLASLRGLSRAQVLFGLGIMVYLVTRLVNLPAFPIYFISDEAIQQTQAERLVQNGFTDPEDGFLPTYFANDDKYSIGTTVYVQVLPYLVSGKTIWGTRATTALIALLGMIWVSWMLRDIFHLSVWWATPYLFTMTPIWLLFTRSGFETAQMVTYYVGFLYFYLRYRTGRPRYLYLALILGALAFYTYTPAQLVVVVSGVLLLAVDARYHWQNRAVTLRGLGLLLVLSLPQVRFLLQHPQEYSTRFQMYDAFWISDASLLQKFGQYARYYLEGLNPFYWFLPNSHDPVLYRMGNIGHIFWWMLPLWFVGLVRTLQQWRDPRYRVLLAAVLAAPTGAAMVSVQVARVLTLLIPFIAFMALGLEAYLTEFIPRFHWRAARVEPILAGVGGLVSLGLLAWVLISAPTWFEDYSMSGMQWGARQMTALAETYQRRYPNTHLYITGSWGWQGGMVLNFFLPPSDHISCASVDHFLSHLDGNINSAAFLITGKELDQAVQSGKFNPPQIEQVINYPNGQPGYYLVRLSYSPDAVRLFTQEAERSKILELGEVMLGGQQVKVEYTLLDRGWIGYLFDGDLSSLIKSQEINPLVVRLTFPEPRELHTVTAQVGSEAVQAILRCTTSEGKQIVLSQQDRREENKQITFTLDQPALVSVLEFELTDLDVSEREFVHLWELSLQ